MGCCGNKTSYKITIGQVRELAATVKDAVKEAAKSGEILVTKDISDRRFNLCKLCPKLQGERCNECGCFIRAKVKLKISKCPIHKW